MLASKALWHTLLATFLLSAICISANPAHAQAQADEPWTQFAVKAKQEEHYGYKDANGHVRIPAKFDGFTNARTFRHIMAVMESKSNDQYYLLKSGRKVGVDSVYMFDYTFDCESEGKIRFRDQRRNRVGFFDAQGRIVIPAIYNYVTSFHNGVAVALRGATRTCLDGSDTLTCEHPGWRGGQQVLINQRNEVLADLSNATAPTFHLNWYSLQRNAPTPDTATTVTLSGVHGDRYTFTAYDREFREWFFGTFVPTVRSEPAEKISALCFSDLAVASRPFRGWPHVGRAAFVAKYQSLLRARLGTLQRGAEGVQLGAGDLNTLIFTDPAFQPFLTDCGGHFEEKYPVFEVILTYPAPPTNQKFDHQEHFEFIRTASGYRLFSVSL